MKDNHVYASGPMKQHGIKITAIILPVRVCLSEGIPCGWSAAGPEPNCSHFSVIVGPGDVAGLRVLLGK